MALVSYGPVYQQVRQALPSGPVELWPSIVMALYSYCCIVMALYSYGRIWLWHVGVVRRVLPSERGRYDGRRAVRLDDRAHARGGGRGPRPGLVLGVHILIDKLNTIARLL